MSDHSGEGAPAGRRESRKVNAKQLVTDIKNGLSFHEIAERYSVSGDQLRKLFGQLVAKGLINKTEVPPDRTCERNELIEPLKPQRPQAQDEEMPHATYMFKQDQKDPAAPFFMRYWIPIISVGVAVVVLLVVIGIYWVKEKRAAEAKAHQEQIARVEAQERLKEARAKTYEPMRNEVAAAMKQIEAGLSFEQHREMHKDFIRRLGQFQLTTRNQDPVLISLLDQAAHRLSVADAIWAALNMAPSDQWRRSLVEALERLDSVDNPDIIHVCQQIRDDKFSGVEAATAGKRFREECWRDFGRFCAQALERME